MCNHKIADLEILNRPMLNHNPKNSRNVNNNPPKHFFMYWKPARLSEEKTLASVPETTLLKFVFLD